MGQTILLAEPCELLRVGLHTIFAEDPRVSRIYETSTSVGLEKLLGSSTLELIVVNQALITRMTILPKGHFVILAAEPDMIILKAAYKYGARGYLSEGVSADLLRMTLDPFEKAFLIEPALMPWLMDCGIFADAFSSIKEKFLTPREREIIDLVRKGLDRPTIARDLGIAEVTLKTHLKNIARKRRDIQMNAQQFEREPVGMYHAALR